MGHFTKSSITLQSYEQIYNTSIRPKLEAIDLFIKSNEMPYKTEEAASILDLELTELINIMKENNIIELNAMTFFHVIYHASSEICKLISRQWQYQGVDSYTPQAVSDIYGLNLHNVTSAFKELNADCVAAHELIDVFKRIHTTVYA